MEKYVSLADEYVTKFKPIIEERIGIKLENIIVRDSSEYQNFDPYPYLYGAPMFVALAEFPNTIFVKDCNFEGNVVFTSTPIDIVHELSHFIYKGIVLEELRKTKSKSRIARLKKGWKLDSFKEGFAEYMSLDNLIDVYDKKTLSFLKSYQDDLLPRKEPHKSGYKFFRDVLSVIGKDRVFEVARAPPVSQIEVKTPILYLLRRYPAKAIRDIPKFVKKRLRAKIKKITNEYTPMRFVLPGEFRNLKVNAIKS